MTPREWYVDHFQVCSFYWWLVKRGHITDVHDAGRYFDDPTGWCRAAGSLHAKYELEQNAVTL